MKEDNKNIKIIRKEIVDYALKYNISQAARKFNTTRVTVTKWVSRFKEFGEKGLENSIRKNWCHKNETPDYIRDSIIKYKLKHPYSSLNKIKKDLSLDCNISTINRILIRVGVAVSKNNSRNNFLDMKSVQAKSIKPFGTIIFDIKKLKFNRSYKVRNQDFPEYLFIAHDLYSELLFLSFSDNNYPTDQELFLSYIRENLKNKGVENSETTYISLNNKAITKILKKQDIEQTFGTNDNLKYLSNSLSKEIVKYISKYSNEKNITNSSLLEKSYSYLLMYNSFQKKVRIGNKTTKDVLFDLTRKDMSKLTLNILHLPPVIIKDNKEDNIEYGTKGYIELFEREINIIKKNTETTLAESKYSASKRNLKKMIELLDNQLVISDDKKLKRVYLKNKLRLLKDLGEWENILNSYKNILGTFKKRLGHSDKDKIEFLLDYAIVLFFDLQVEEAIKKNKIALRLSIKFKEKKFELISNYQLAQAYLERGNLKLANKYKEKVEKFKNIKKKEKQYFQFKLYSLLYGYYQKIEKYSDSLEEMKNYLKLALAINDAKKICNSYSNLSLIYRKIRNFEKSFEYSNKLIELAKLENNDFKLLKSYGNMGNHYFVTKDFKKAVVFYSKELRLINKAEIYKHRKIQALTGIIKSNNESKNHLASVDYCFELISLAKKNNIQNYLSNSYFLLGETYIGLGKKEEALKYFSISRDLYKTLDDKYRMKEVEKVIKEVSQF